MSGSSVQRVSLLEVMLPKGASVRRRARLARSGKVAAVSVAVVLSLTVGFSGQVTGVWLLAFAGLLAFAVAQTWTVFARYGARSLPVPEGLSEPLAHVYAFPSRRE